MAGIPQGFHTITPQIHVTNGDKAIALYKKALGAKELHRMIAPSTKKIMHACREIGSSKLFLSDHNPPGQVMRARTRASIFTLMMWTRRTKGKVNGLKEAMPPTDMFWGDRMSAVIDPFGHNWNLATFNRPLKNYEASVAETPETASLVEQKCVRHAHVVLSSTREGVGQGRKTFFSGLLDFGVATACGGAPLRQSLQVI